MYWFSYTIHVLLRKFKYILIKYIQIIIFLSIKLMLKVPSLSNVIEIDILMIKILFENEEIIDWIEIQKKRQMKIKYTAA